MEKWIVYYLNKDDLPESRDILSGTEAEVKIKFANEHNIDLDDVIAQEYFEESKTNISLSIQEMTQIFPAIKDCPLTIKNIRRGHQNRGRSKWQRPPGGPGRE